MAGFAGVLGGIGQAVQGFNAQEAQSLERRKALQALSMQELQYQQAKRQDQQAQSAAAANFGALTAVPGALPGAQSAAGPAPAAPQPQGPQPPMPGQPSVPKPTAMPAGGAMPPSQPSPAAPSAGPASGGPSSASLPQGGSPGASPQGQPQLSQPADMLRQMAMQIRQANPGIDPGTAMEAIKQRVDLMKGLEPDLKNQITFLSDMMRNQYENRSVDERYMAAIMQAQTREDMMRLRHEWDEEKSRNNEKWQLMTDPEHQDESGKTVPATQYWASAPGLGRPPQYLDMGGQPYTPFGAAKLGGGSASGTATGSRESAQMNRIISAGNEAVGDLQNVMRLPIGTTRGWIGPRADSLSGITRDALVNEVTPQATQSYNVRAAGLQRSMAAIEAAGLMPSGTLTHQMDAVIINPGDSYQTALEKMAQARQIAERGLEPLLDNPRLSTPQKAGINKIMGDLKKAVPFTIEDIDRLSTSDNPKATLGSYAKGEGLGSGDIPQEAIDELKSGKGSADQFDQIFGPGSAKKVLGQ